jgi:hypothetical protein
MNTKHTPGPWTTYRGSVWSKDPSIDRSKRSNIVCAISERLKVPESEQQANARLIAAAPELVDACITALSVLDVVDGRHGGHAAIAAQRIRSLLQKIDS